MNRGAALFAAVTLAASPPSSVQVRGDGGLSCATWLSTQTAYGYGNEWVWGFWTGANAVSAAAGTTDGKVGRSTDNLGIVGEVRKICEAEPSIHLFAAAARTFNRFRDAGL